MHEQNFWGEQVQMLMLLSAKICSFEKIDSAWKAEQKQSQWIAHIILRSQHFIILKTKSKLRADNDHEYNDEADLLN